MADLWAALQITATAFGIPLLLSVEKKLTLNNKKYPVNLCKGSVRKLTAYSYITGITKENQYIDIMEEGRQNAVHIDGKLVHLTTRITNFVNTRDWGRFDIPRNLDLALLVEVGELAELVQWEGDICIEPDGVIPTVNINMYAPQQLNKMAQELADITNYLLKLANACNLVKELQNAVSQTKETKI